MASYGVGGSEGYPIGQFIRGVGDLNSDDYSFGYLLRSDSMDQGSELRLGQPVQTADSKGLLQELGINQREGSQAPAATRLLRQPLASSTGDSNSHRNIGPKGEEARRKRKRENDKKYRDKQKDKKQALKDENDRLKQEIQEKDKQEQLMKSKLEELDAENGRLKCELEENKQLTKSFLDVIGVVKEQQKSTANMEPVLAQIRLVMDGFESLKRDNVSLNRSLAQLHNKFEVQQIETQQLRVHLGLL